MTASPPAPGSMRARLFDESITRQKIRPGTLRRIVPYATRHRWWLTLLLLATGVSAVVAALSPLILKVIIDDGITQRNLDLVIKASLGLVGLALVDVLAIFGQTLVSARIGQGLVYELRTTAFRHVQRQPIAFFTRVQTGSLVSRLNTDIVGAQQAVTTVLAQVFSIVLTVSLVLAAMFTLSWQLSVAALVMFPIFFLPAKLFGPRMQRLVREGMHQDAAMGSLMNERFNVAGATLAKLNGDPEREAASFGRLAGKVRDVLIRQDVYGRMFFISTTLLTACTTALVYGLGGALVIDGVLQIGTLVALVTLLLRLYGPINQLTSMQRNIVTALVSFDRVFELLDLEPVLTESPDARPLIISGTAAPDVEFDRVSFRYPVAAQVSLASLERPMAFANERTSEAWILDDVRFRAPAGKLTALVGPSGAGKSTIAHLVSRLYDPLLGAVRIGGQDLRDVTLASLRTVVGVVSQDAHLFHDTIRMNLQYARPDATDADLAAACRAARIEDTIAALPEGLDTVVGERGYRLSGGEKQRLALARVLLRNPPIVVLDEATAHLDSESEAAIQQALATALSGRTSLVIAHRLATVRDADQILVIRDGKVTETGTHESLYAAGGLYADLYRTQFATQAEAVRTS